jgi:hypothetical protein
MFFDLEALHPAEPVGGSVRASRSARVPSGTLGNMLTSTVEALPPSTVMAHLEGLPPALGYSLHIEALDYHDRPYLSGMTDFDARTITLHIPDPFYPFGEVIPYAATRRPGTGSEAFRFIWLSEGVTFSQPCEVVRYLYLHEWMHWYLRECLGRKGQAETACDRFALRNYQRSVVTVEDARAALARRRS